MPSHVPDDFRFLPTVDSTDEELAELETLKEAGVAGALQEPTASQEAMAHEALLHQIVAAHDAEASVDVPVQDISASEQNGGDLWQEFMQQSAAAMTPEETERLEESPPAMVEVSLETQPQSLLSLEEAPVEAPSSKAHSSSPQTERLRGRGKRQQLEPPPVSFSGKSKETAETSSEPSPPTSSMAELEAQPFVAPKLPPEEPLDPETARKHRWKQLVDKAGFRSLGWSVGAHMALLVLAAFIGYNQVMDKEIDFLSGGDSAQARSAAAELTHQIQQKKNPWLKERPQLRKITVQSMASNIVLPEMSMDSLDLSSITNRMDISKASTQGLGMGLGGAGGGLGAGMGIGGNVGSVFGPLFGMNVKAKKLAVVLDVSPSMVPHLSRVVSEVDKVAKGAVVILYVGCGLAPPDTKLLVGTRVFRTSGVEFEKFWRLGGATYMDASKFKINARDPIPDEAIFRQLARRPQTYFIHRVQLEYTWLALLSEEVRNADALYWFSDFEDQVDFQQLSIVLENLNRRRQRLYIHSYGRGLNFELIKNQLALPTKGDAYLEE